MRLISGMFRGVDRKIWQLWAAKKKNEKLLTAVLD